MSQFPMQHSPENKIGLTLVSTIATEGGGGCTYLPICLPYQSLFSAVRFIKQCGEWRRKVYFHIRRFEHWQSTSIVFVDVTLLETWDGLDMLPLHNAESFASKSKQLNAKQQSDPVIDSSQCQLRAAHSTVTGTAEAEGAAFPRLSKNFT